MDDGWCEVDGHFGIEMSDDDDEADETSILTRICMMSITHSFRELGLYISCDELRKRLITEPFSTLR